MDAGNTANKIFLKTDHRHDSLLLEGVLDPLGGKDMNHCTCLSILVLLEAEYTVTLSSAL